MLEPGNSQIKGPTGWKSWPWRRILEVTLYCGSLFFMLSLLVLALLPPPASPKTTQEVIDQFLRASAARDLDGMYARYNHSISRDEFSNTVAYYIINNDYIGDYDGLEMNNGISSVNMAGQNLLEVTGTVHYKKRGTGAFSALVRREAGNEVRIFNFNLQPPQPAPVI